MNETALQVLPKETMSVAAPMKTTTREGKTAWQRAKRQRFKEQFGYSMTAHYATKGQRERILKRDNYQCVQCGLTDAEHKSKWRRPITIDHRSKDRSDNSDSNLQTLCLSCHGRKDLIQRLRHPKFLAVRDQALALRRAGATYDAIGKSLGFSTAIAWKWLRKWEGETQ